MAHIKATATTKGNRDSIAKRLGIKLFAGETVQPGSILVRQKGTKFNPGVGTKMGKDYTIYAVKTGVVQFKRLQGKAWLTIK
jgi:large subunit ribosomal protein L27